MFCLELRDLLGEGNDGERGVRIENVLCDERGHGVDAVFGNRVVPEWSGHAKHGVAQDLCGLDGLGVFDAAVPEKDGGLLLRGPDGRLAESRVFSVGEEKPGAYGLGDRGVGTKDAIRAVYDPLLELVPICPVEGGSEAEVVSDAAHKTLFQCIKHERVLGDGQIEFVSLVHAVCAKAQGEGGTRVGVVVISKDAAPVDGEDGFGALAGCLHEGVDHLRDIVAVRFSGGRFPEKFKYGVLCEERLVFLRPQHGQKPDAFGGECWTHGRYVLRV